MSPIIHQIKNIIRPTACTLLLASCFVTHAQTQAWPEVKKEMKPWSRWWWMGSAVDAANLSAEMNKYAAAGIGGMEITPIYGAKGFEDKYLPFLSDGWMNMLSHTLAVADSLGMGIDMNTGTGWPFGGPHIMLSEAASRLIIQKYSLAGGKTLTDPIKVDNPKQAPGAVLQSVVAYGSKNRVVDVTAHLDASGHLNWKAPKGEWTLYAAFAGKTLQVVKRPAPGGEGYTFDHFSKEALHKYLSRFDSAFAGKDAMVRNFFNDSYEVFGASWSPVFFDEFKTRRGYDLRLHLRELNGDGDSALMARIKCDYRQTMSDLVHDHFTVGWTQWAHAKGAGTKNQSHGSPANLLDLYATVDVPEIETFGGGEFPIPGYRRDSLDAKYSDTDPLFQKFASSGAHTTGKNLVSCETFTWLREHFKTSLMHMKPEVDQLFAAGVNHLFFHGTTFSPAEAGWPGWLFYASVHFGPTNSFWNHLDDMSDYITRCQSVLQSGSHDNDVLVYWPVYDIWQDASGMEKQLTVHNAHNWLHMQPVRDLMARGYSFDFVSDAQIEAITLKDGGLVTHQGVNPYKTIIVPEADYMPVATLKKLIELAHGGARVIFEKLPADVPGYHDLQRRRDVFRSMLSSLAFEKVNGLSLAQTGDGTVMLSSDLRKALDVVGVSCETLTDRGLRFMRRKANGGYYYFLTNLSDNAVDGDIPLCRSASSVVYMNPMNGKVGVAASRPQNNGMQVRVQLQPGESCILWLTDVLPQGTASWRYIDKTGTPIVITTPWQLQFVSGGPVLPQPVTLDTIRCWTRLGNNDMNRFSGVASYTTTFHLKKNAADYLLQLDQLYETARVYINDREVGVVWALPATLRVGEYLHNGDNTIRIEVANLMANRIRWMDQQGMSWRNFREINFVNIAYKPFDASKWDVQPSGVDAPVVLVPVE
ncbi:alpha-L-rhamnosidase-like protein [Breznakibacter xylanolyticus]|uniref:Alpha-L-rhamnosidase-like protein n=1 Tax=Breznakibacter xylanolyticus TaxID=990 RepID=A0A2W7NGP2_9BACT|nr:glycosyl hydrolase [Breznakibacter xylanolyticus]PZX18643.1 alpha-L-rhamnosidase-like protein [Breznakibacter xylanolyticus]